MPMGLLLAIDVFLLTSAHEEEHVEAPSSEVVHHKIKPTTVLDYRKYKIDVYRSDQMLSYYLLERKMIKWWKELIIHPLFLAVVIAQTYTPQHTVKKNCWKFSMKIC
jgi:hypothetical protein